MAARILQISIRGSLKGDSTPNELESSMKTALQPHEQDASKTVVKFNGSSLFIYVVVNGAARLDAICNFLTNVVDSHFIVEDADANFKPLNN